MNKWIIGSMAVVLSYGAVACGDDTGGGSGLGAKQQAVIDLTMKKAKEFGITADDSCVNKLAAQLSDADAQLLLDNPDGDPTLSDAGEKLGDQLKDCFKVTADSSAAGGDSAGGDLNATMKATIVDSIMSTLGASMKLDRACVEEAIGTLEAADLQAASTGGSSTAFTQVGTKIALECVLGN